MPRSGSGVLQNLRKCDRGDGLFKKARGLIFGCYDETANPELMARLRRIGDRYAIPVVYTADFGHGGTNGIIPIGAWGALDGGKRRLTFE